MHQVILVRLEEYLSGSPSPREFTAHLESCEECRGEVSEMLELSVLTTRWMIESHTR